LKYNFSFSCKNRLGKYSYGRKITNIEFVNRTQALVTTNDSRIRLVNISDGKMIQKYKGHLNEEYMIRAFVEDSNDMVISASEDGNVLTWTKFNKESNKRKNYNYEMFRPFAKDTSSCSLIVMDECAAQYMKKLFNLTNKVMVYSILINASVGGRLQVLLNCDEI
jgi:WD40 repeat protein